MAIVSISAPFHRCKAGLLVKIETLASFFRLLKIPQKDLQVAMPCRSNAALQILDNQSQQYD